MPRSSMLRLVVAGLALVFVVTPAAAQQGDATPGDAAPADAVPADVMDVPAYLDSALAIMRDRVIGRDTVDWDAFRDSVHAWAAPARDLSDAHWALMTGAHRLNPHSFLRPTDASMARLAQRLVQEEMAEAGAAERAAPAVRSPFAGRRTPQGWLHERAGVRIGHVAIPAFGRAHTTAFADSIQAFVRGHDAGGACGWIVDLRGNGGGNMWPMLAGVGALLDGDTLGWFHEAGAPPTPWYHRNGTAGMVMPDSLLPIASVTEPYEVEGVPPVAVLFDGATASSGEATAIAFIGRANARSFGEPSFGFTTSNEGFVLPDGANLVLTVGVEADRLGVVHEGRLQPDVTVPIVPAGAPMPAEPPAADPQLEAALDWVRGQPGCAN